MSILLNSLLYCIHLQFFMVNCLIHLRCVAHRAKLIQRIPQISPIQYYSFLFMWLGSFLALFLILIKISKALLCPQCECPCHRSRRSLQDIELTGFSSVQLNSGTRTF
uniref:Uncharacterized protein n=1 Tax=Chelydra serpentina TaxID=8475 RepID=A0A8C3XUB6_CHESE